MVNDAGAKPAPHPPKIELFDLTTATNTDPKGFIRAVDEFRVEPWGLYMARPADHPQFHYLESWLLPSLGLRASVFHYNQGCERDQDFYIDIGEYTTSDDGQLYHAEDHYLDIVCKTGTFTTLLDIDELLEAHALGLLPPTAAVLAIQRATTALVGLAAHNQDLGLWLHSCGMTVSWKTPPASYLLSNPILEPTAKPEDKRH
ncbi:MAG: DUF402 domain-containing protein [Mycobacteriaceae bacterium]